MLLHVGNDGQLSESATKKTSESKLSMTCCACHMALFKVKLKTRAPNQGECTSSPHLVQSACQLLLADMRRLVASHRRSHQ